MSVFSKISANFREELQLLNGFSQTKDASAAAITFPNSELAIRRWCGVPDGLARRPILVVYGEEKTFFDLRLNTAEKIQRALVSIEKPFKLFVFEALKGKRLIADRPMQTYQVSKNIGVMRPNPVFCEISFDQLAAILDEIDNRQGYASMGLNEAHNFFFKQEEMAEKDAAFIGGQVTRRLYHRSITGQGRRMPRSQAKFIRRSLANGTMSHQRAAMLRMNRKIR